MITTISRKFRIDAGHRVYGHEGKCSSLHGHSYEFIFTFGKPEIDSLGRIIDFGEIKRYIGSWLEENLDHAMILYSGDPIVKYYEEHPEFKTQKYYVLKENPTAENLARFLFQFFFMDVMIRYGITLLAVQCGETPNCWSDHKGNIYVG